MKNKIATEIPGVFKIELFHAGDDRGSFTKVFHGPSMNDWDLPFELAESYFSISQKGVIRGMHFQIPPEDHEKIVYCNTGKLNDVLLDIRKDSPTFGKSVSLPLGGSDRYAVYVPKGIAHGFEVLEDNTMMTYLVSSAHAPECDKGILWNSFNHDWETQNPTLSKRDQEFASFENFKTPF